MMKVGSPVTVTNPKHKHSVHSHGFYGTIIGITFDKNYEVEDQDGNVWEVSPDEIKTDE